MDKQKYMGQKGPDAGPLWRSRARGCGVSGANLACMHRHTPCQTSMRQKGKLSFWFASFCSKSEFSLHPLSFYLSIDVQFLRFFYLRIFNDKKSLDVIILLITWFLKYFLLSRFRLVFLPTTLASLSPEVKLLSRVVPHREIAQLISKKHPKKACPSENDLTEAQ